MSSPRISQGRRGLTGQRKFGIFSASTGRGKSDDDDDDDDDDAAKAQGGVGPPGTTHHG